MKELTTQEKIDYIYKVIKKQEDRKRFFLYLKISLYSFGFLFISYMYFFGINQIINGVKNSINQSIVDKKDSTLDFIKNKTESIKSNIKNINNY